RQRGRVNERRGAPLPQHLPWSADHRRRHRPRWRDADRRGQCSRSRGLVCNSGATEGSTGDSSASQQTSYPRTCCGCCSRCCSTGQRV
ncbi:hypothetical protein JG687_00016603, partial [Phytophthora cactorum]